MSRKIGLIAGWGRFPVVVAEALRHAGYEVYCVGIRDHADAEALRPLCTDYYPSGLTRLGAHIRYFQRHGVRCATMAGKIHKVRLFQPFFLLRHFPDWRCLRTFYPHWVSKSQDRKDDTLLSAVVRAYAEDGIRCAAATDFAPELLVKYGKLSGGRLSPAQVKDVEFGWQLAKEMGRLDVGQSVAVKGQAVLAVEAVEGTDECIRRAGQLCPQGGFTVVKVAKPQQDMRFDVPTVGVGTLEVMAQAGARVLAIEAHRTIIIDEPELVRTAQRHGITIVALHDGQVDERLAA